MTEKAKVHALPTEKATSLFKVDGLFYYGLNATNLGRQSHHLYFTTDEEIKIGDWVILYAFGDHIRQVRKEDLSNDTWMAHVKGKIVATTDKDLWWDREYYDVGDSFKGEFFVDKLKLRSNGTVIIHPIKRDFSEEQLIDAILNNTNMTVAEVKAWLRNRYPTKY
jgi:hypothetical protein